MPGEVSREAGDPKPASGGRPPTLIAAAIGAFVMAAGTAAGTALRLLRGPSPAGFAAVSVILGALFALYFVWTGRQLLRGNRAAYALFRALFMMNCFGALVMVVHVVAMLAQAAPRSPSLLQYASASASLAFTFTMTALLHAPGTRRAVGEPPTGGSALTLYLSPMVWLLMLAAAVVVRLVIL